jgi:hypothetical protein
MYEILKEQFKSGKALTQNKYQSSIKKENWAKFYWEMYPLNQDYYHEFNPVFLFNLYKEDFFKFTPVLTVRDGYVPFATFIMNNFMTFSRYSSNLFLIIARIYFSSTKISLLLFRQISHNILRHGNVFRKNKRHLKVLKMSLSLDLSVINMSGAWKN